MRIERLVLFLFLAACGSPDRRCVVEFDLSEVVLLNDGMVQLTATWRAASDSGLVYLQGEPVEMNGSSQLVARSGDVIRLQIGSKQCCVEERTVLISEDTPILLPRVYGVVRGYQAAADASVSINDVTVATDADGGFEFHDVLSPYSVVIGRERFEGLHSDYLELHGETPPAPLTPANAVVKLDFGGLLPAGDEIRWQATSGTQRLSGIGSVLPFYVTEPISAGNEVVILATQEDVIEGSVLNRSIVSIVAVRNQATSEFSASLNIPARGGRSVSVETECPCAEESNPFLFFGVYNPSTLLEYSAPVPSEITPTMSFPSTIGLPLFVERSFTDVSDPDLTAGYSLKKTVSDLQSSVSLSRPPPITLAYDAALKNVSIEWAEAGACFIEFNIGIRGGRMLTMRRSIAVSDLASFLGVPVSGASDLTATCFIGRDTDSLLNNPTFRLFRRNRGLSSYVRSHILRFDPE